MYRKPLIFSILCILILCGLGVHTWLNLPEIDRYPIHWNAKGEADGFGSKRMVAVNLSIIPITSIFMAALLAGLPKIEPLAKNLKSSQSAYVTTWMFLMGFMVFIGWFIVMPYRDNGTLPVDNVLPFIAIANAVLFIGIGNVLGKVRQNFMFGVRTPWTLSSELSWEKTHRVMAKVFVIGGLLTILVALLKSEAAFIVSMIHVAVITVVSLVYSYKVWKSDPNKRE